MGCVRLAGGERSAGARGRAGGVDERECGKDEGAVGGDGGGVGLGAGRWVFLLFVLGEVKGRGEGADSEWRFVGVQDL